MTKPRLLIHTNQDPPIAVPLERTAETESRLYRLVVTLESLLPATSATHRLGPERPNQNRKRGMRCQKSGLSAIGTCASSSVPYLCGFSAQTFSAHSSTGFP